MSSDLEIAAFVGLDWADQKHDICLLVAGQTAALHPLVFWGLALSVNVAVTGLLVVMAYTVAYFGVTQPDRVVKARLFQWLLRGPVVAPRKPCSAKTTRAAAAIR